MPIVVDEVVISVDVSGNNNSGGQASGPMNEEEKQQLISICVEKVLEVLKQKTER